jgi:hypothetical protein
MATITSISAAPQTASLRALRSAASRSAVRRRRITPQAGRALEVLGHAIEYLTDEYIYRGGQFYPGDPEVQAVQLLAATNRAIYLECPEVPTLGERCLRLLGIGRS